MTPEKIQADIIKRLDQQRENIINAMLGVEASPWVSDSGELRLSGKDIAHAEIQTQVQAALKRWVNDEFLGQLDGYVQRLMNAQNGKLRAVITKEFRSAFEYQLNQAVREHARLAALRHAQELVEEFKKELTNGS